MALSEVLKERPRSLGLVSMETPLISNLNVIENIALILQYHGGMSRKHAYGEVMRYLVALGLEGIAEMRNTFLSDRERFAVMLLRAVMVKENYVVIDRPFKLVPSLIDCGYVLDLLKKLDDRLHMCLIMDYAWNEGRYMGIDICQES